MQPSAAMNFRRWGSPRGCAIETAGLLKRAEDLRMVECDACGTPHIEEVEVFDASVGKPRAYIFCPDAGRVSVEPERLQVWRIDFESLASFWLGALGCRQPRSAIAEDRIWLLGTGNSLTGPGMFSLSVAPRGRTAHALLAGQRAPRCVPLPADSVPEPAFLMTPSWFGGERIIAGAGRSSSG